MIYLIEYHRQAGRLISLKEFPEEEREVAESERLELELLLLRERAPHEVVVLEAESTPDLRHTHRRYFEELSSLTDRILEYPTKSI